MAPASGSNSKDFALKVAIDNSYIALPIVGLQSGLEKEIGSIIPNVCLAEDKSWLWPWVTL